MPGPTITFGFILATLYGAAFHLLSGGDVRRMALYMLAAWSGFALGQMLAITLALNILVVGALHVGPASLCSLGSLLFIHLLTRSTRRTR